MTVVYGRHSGCAGGSDGPLPSRTGQLQAAAVDPVLDLTCSDSVRESMAELGGP
ncbi:hypothetical protein CASFOL_029275 [Castilleja foliolosa]|uniref:Uncharacterized protein n=1 Tax=Castilleja foliolosa TaxID=1961234 RepID=A0ABD3CAK1_9LAMI